MIYFIPAWYHQNEWKENEQLWYRRRMKSETDDTVKQIQLFQRNDICDYQILLLSHAPNLRHFLHRQSMFRAPYWSCFDAIQEVRRKKPAILSFHNLNWPKDIEFIYSPFAVIAMLHGEKYAQIEFGEDGNPIQVDLYNGGQVNRKNIYDDRGFISCTIVYESEQMTYEQYLTENGEWKICHFADGHVIVNPKNNSFLIRTKEDEKIIPYRKLSYTSLEEIIEEVLSAYLEFTLEEDIFCAALHPRHMELLNRLLADKKTIFSTFNERLILAENSQLKVLLSHADYIVADSEKNMQLIVEESKGNYQKIANIPPYDTRVDFGISQQLHVQKILLPVDNLPLKLLEKVILVLADYLTENTYARVHLFTRNADYNRQSVILEQIREILEDGSFPPEWAREEKNNKFEVLLDEKDQLPILFRVEQCVDELTVNKTLREQRILLDLAEVPDLFLQISAISMGVPQIVRTQTQYVHPEKNGRVNKDIMKLKDDLAFYLESLSNWNQAMVASYELGKKHTAKSLISQWKEVIEEVEQGTGTTTGE